MRKALVVLAFLSLVLAGCASSAPEFVDAQASYDQPQLQERLTATDTGSLKQTPVIKAPALRTTALAALRGEGEVAAGAATLITRSFPPKTMAVPVYVERAQFSGSPVLVVIEAYGASAGTLDRKRLWVLDESGQILFSAASK